MPPSKAFRLILFAALGVLCVSARAYAQESELTIFVRKNMGYNNGSQIQGSFRIEATGPDKLTSVTFKIDDAVVGAATEPPFKINFDTGDYPLGWRTLTAEGTTADGRRLVSAPRRFEFVSAQQGFETVGKIIAPLFALIALGMFLSLAVIPFLQSFLGQKATLPLGAPRNYGWLGGALCPKCGRPFPLHWWSFKLGFARYDRCDHCGRWSLVRRANREALAEAEAAEGRGRQPPPPTAGPSAEEKLKRQLDESRFLEK